MGLRWRPLKGEDLTMVGAERYPVIEHRMRLSQAGEDIECHQQGAIENLETPQVFTLVKLAIDLLEYP